MRFAALIQKENWILLGLLGFMGLSLACEGGINDELPFDPNDPNNNPQSSSTNPSGLDIKDAVQIEFGQTVADKIFIRRQLKLYRITTILPNQILRVALTTTVRTNVDYEIILYGPDFLTNLGQVYNPNGLSGPTDISLRAQAGAAGHYYIVVGDRDGNDFDRNIPFNLVVEQMAEPDAYEPNNSELFASQLVLPGVPTTNQAIELVVTGFLATAFDRDFYKIDLPPESLMEATLDFSPPLPATEEVLDPSFRFFYDNNSNSRVEHVLEGHAAAYPVQRRTRVFTSSAGQSNRQVVFEVYDHSVFQDQSDYSDVPYTLTINVQLRATDDRNDTLAEAIGASVPGSISGTHAYLSDADWFVFNATTQQILEMIMSMADSDALGLDVCVKLMADPRNANPSANAPVYESDLTRLGFTNCQGHERTTVSSAASGRINKGLVGDGSTGTFFLKISQADFENKYHRTDSYSVNLALSGDPDAAMEDRQLPRLDSNSLSSSYRNLALSFGEIKPLCSDPQFDPPQGQPPTPPDPALCCDDFDLTDADCSASVSGTIGYEGDVDLFKVEIPETKFAADDTNHRCVQIEISIPGGPSNPAYDPYLVMWDPFGSLRSATPMAFQTGPGTVPLAFPTSSGLSLTRRAGTYYFAVWDFMRSEDYANGYFAPGTGVVDLEDYGDHFRPSIDYTIQVYLVPPEADGYCAAVTPPSN